MARLRLTKYTVALTPVMVEALDAYYLVLGTSDVEFILRNLIRKGLEIDGFLPLHPKEER